MKLTEREFNKTFPEKLKSIWDILCCDKFFLVTLKGINITGKSTFDTDAETINEVEPVLDHLKKKISIRNEVEQLLNS